jgi:hypothetical protein
MNLQTQFHSEQFQDATLKSVTYWSVYNQQWVNKAYSVPDRELAAMSDEERVKVVNHLGMACK